MVRAVQLSCVDKSNLSAGLPPTIWYMGAKTRVLNDFLDRVLLGEVPRGATVLDLFSGTGVVSAFCARHFRIHSNDSQRFAQVIAQSFTEHRRQDRSAFLKSLDWDKDLAAAFAKNRATLEELYAPALEEEARHLESLWGKSDEDKSRRARRGPDRVAAIESYREFLSQPGAVYGETGKASGFYRKARSLLSERSILAHRRERFRSPFCLVTTYYSNCYFGVRQAIELDSIRAAIESIDEKDDRFAEKKKTHYLSALMHVASVSTSGTSHFAQPRHFRKDSEIEAMARRRQIDIVSTFLDASTAIQGVVRATSYRAGNRAVCSDYKDLIQEGESGPVFRDDVRADLVYMDPPYTQDNYSRFYHVLETLCEYDYPELERDSAGKILRGRYPVREKRFISGFCSVRGVEKEFETCIQASANSGSGLVISYGSPDGLLLKTFAARRPGKDPVRLFETLCRKYYRKVQTQRRTILHSGQGDRNKETEELLVVCARPR